MSYPLGVSAPWASPPVNWPVPGVRAKWKGAPLEERMTWRDEAFVAHPPAREALQDAWSYVYFCKQFLKSFAMLVVGESGSGKTTFSELLERLVNASFCREEEDRTIKPVLRLEKLPSPCTPNEICFALLFALGDPNPKKRDKSTIKEVTAKMLSECDVRVVVIDNFQDVPMARGEKGIEQVGSAFRDLIDMTKLLWVFLGTNGAKKVVDSDRQLIRRIKYRATLPYFSTVSLKDKKIFLRVLERFDEWLPLAESSADLLKRQSGRIHIGTEGVMERIADLLGQASLFAAKDGREALTSGDLKNAFALLMGRDHENPFSPGFTVRRLDRLGEPFEVMKSARGGSKGGVA